MCSLLVAAMSGLRFNSRLAPLRTQRRFHASTKAACVCCKRQFGRPSFRLNPPATASKHRQPSRHIASRATQVPLEYDAAQNALYWETRPVPVTSRLLHIGWEFMQWWLRAKARKDPVANAARMRDLLVRLGPAFVKIGQALSSRPDVMPPDYLRELEKLQDRIPPFPTPDAFKVLKSELGVTSITEVFSEMSEEPVAAASLGQVYRARLRRGGQEVAVKVQRPGVLESIAMDVYILRLLAEALRRWRKFNTDLPALVDEWATSLFKELDYTREAGNAQRFKHLFSHMVDVYVPIMYLEHTTPRVLTMEWVEGERVHTSSTAPERLEAPLSRAANLALVEVGVQCSLEQMLEEGFYHADPHPGNVLRMTDGRLAYLDFGMMGSIERPVRQGLMRATLHLVNREFGALAEDFVTLGLLPEGSDREQVVPALTAVFEEALRGGVSNLSFGSLSTKLGQTMYQYKFRIPPYYTLLVRSLTVLEGIALVSDPNYKVLGAAYPWVARRLLTDRSPEMRATLDALLYKDGRFQFKRLESLMEQAAKSPARTAPRAGTSGRQQGDSPLASSTNSDTNGTMSASTATVTMAAAAGGGGGGGLGLRLILSDDGEVVRDILLEELAKGLDAAWRLALDQAVLTTRERLKLLLLVDSRRGPGAAQNDGSLVDALLSLPNLADEDDKEQVEGIVRLSGLMMTLATTRQASAAQQRLEAGKSSSGSGSNGTGRPTQTAGGAASSIGGAGGDWSMQQAADGLMWLVQELQGLPEDSRREALRLPLGLATKLSSRVAARAIRTAFGGR